MQTINVVRNAETISLLTTNGAGVVCVDIPIPRNIGDSIVVKTECLNLNVPSAEIIRRSANIEKVDGIGLVGTRYAMGAWLYFLHRMQNALEERLQMVGQKRKQDTGVLNIITSRIRKKKSIKSIRGKKKIN
ncbi:MAG: hypothetical protein WC365_08440 [Candidatus Babeliales bacterium]|jgi:hypothetical protein